MLVARVVNEKRTNQTCGKPVASILTPKCLTPRFCNATVRKGEDGFYDSSPLIMRAVGDGT